MISTVRHPDYPPLDTARRPQIPARFASRRQFSEQQENQENSGEAEAEMMMNELVGVRTRFNQDNGHTGNLDDTPPPIGRFERLTLGGDE